MHSYENKKVTNFATEENSRYRKKKQSNSSKARAKPDHKHIKQECLLICKPNQIYHSHYCAICGEIIDWQISMVKENYGSFGMVYRELNYKEIMEKYKDLEVKEITDIFEKYLSN